MMTCPPIPRPLPPRTQSLTPGRPRRVPAVQRRPWALHEFGLVGAELLAQELRCPGLDRGMGEGELGGVESVAVGLMAEGC